MFTVTKEFGFDAGHRLIGHEGKCAHVHGHRYTARVSCISKGHLDQVGRVVDFSCIKELVGGWIEANLDHAFIANIEDPIRDWLRENRQRFYTIDCNPTAENIAKLIFDRAVFLLTDIEGVEVVGVKVWETPSCSATYTPDLEYSL